MQTDKQLGDELLELAETIHFLPWGFFDEIRLEELIKFDVGTTMNGRLRIRTQTEEEFLEGEIEVMPDGIQFNHA